MYSASVMAPISSSCLNFKSSSAELGAAGAVEAIFTALSLKEDFAPATIGYREPDPECDLDIVPNEGRKALLRYAMSNSLGFGGHNASILLKKWEA